MSQQYPNLPLTDFPNAVDTYESFLDMTQADYTLVKQYQDALEKQDLSLAQQIFAQIPQATQKIISALRLNQLREAILALEKFYGTDIKPYIDIKQAEWESYVNRFQYKGIYNPTTSYILNNFVQYNNNGHIGLYINIFNGVTPISTLPTNTTYWRLFTIQGLQGDAGEGANFSFDWSSTITYTIGTIVVYGNAWWIATQINQNQPPEEGSIYWDLVLNISQQIYPVQPSQPAGQLEGELWFRTL